MMRRTFVVAAASVVVASGCIDNRAPGNDREASLDSAPPAAEMASAGDAIAGVSAGLLYPEIITDADQRSLPEPGPCSFRFTRVGFPAFLFDSSSGVVKLNGKLVRLPAAGDGRYSDAGVGVTFRPLGERGVGAFSAELVMRLAGSAHELGFHGFAEC